MSCVRQRAQIYTISLISPAPDARLVLCGAWGVAAGQQQCALALCLRQGKSATNHGLFRCQWNPQIVAKAFDEYPESFKKNLQRALDLFSHKRLPRRRRCSREYTRVKPVAYIASGKRTTCSRRREEQRQGTDGSADQWPAAPMHRPWRSSLLSCRQTGKMLLLGRSAQRRRWTKCE